VLAAGDATDFPVKHGDIAAQQADAVAETIAAQLGAIAAPEPFRAELRGVLLTGDRPLYLRADALTWPPGKVAGRYLTPWLAS
jgi:sulfide:quinone oxidoreductase